MSFDGIVTKAVVNELSTNLIGGRIDKIYQQEKDEILLIIRNKGTNYKLLISSSSNNPRIYITNYSKENPQSPPMFCMLLRKHLSGGTILNIEQYSLDRIIFIDISSIDELGQPIEKRLVIEIMGKHSNIILINKDDQKIIDSIKRVNHDMSRIRQILPGFKYECPPTQNKSNPLFTSKEEFLYLIENNKQNLPIYKFFYYNYIGISPLISREVCFHANVEIDRSIGSLDHKDLDDLYTSFNNLIDSVHKRNFNPMYIKNEMENIVAFYCFDLNQFGNTRKYFSPSISEVLEIIYKKKDNFDRITQKSQHMKKTIQTKLDRTLNKLSKQKEELIESKNREKYKIYADLISANLHKITERIENIELENFYDPNMDKILVPLDKKITPADNAQKYYKKFSKLKTAESLLINQIYETEEEIKYLENVLMGIENSTEVKELDEIKDELIKEGYLKGNFKNKPKKKQKDTISSPHHYISKDGFNIYVGKNNRQNDYLTLKLAHKDDLWLHVQNMPGSHVIIKTDKRDIPKSTLEEAALLAAYYSKGKNSKNIPVDYTERKNVRKARNTKPGMVIYDNFKTMFVSPTKNLIANLKKVEN